jgi:hypothetical protein
VNAISDRAGAVVQFAVTACDREFQPTFARGKGGSSEGSVTLNTTKLPAMDHLVPLNAEYVMPGNTANNYMFDVFYGASPGSYKTYAWGINDACPDFWADQRRTAYERLASSRTLLLRSRCRAGRSAGGSRTWIQAHSQPASRRLRPPTLLIAFDR